jgi:hypothetical protein
METEIKTKWTIAETENAGDETVSLVTANKTQLEHRFQTGEFEQFTADVKALKKKRTGQSENLLNQKSKTIGKDDAAKELHHLVINIRQVAASSKAPTEVKIAYGVGEKISDSVSGETTAGNIVVSAYKKYPEWSSQAGIVAADVAKVSALIEALSGADDDQSGSIYDRKAATKSKNVLQASVEYGVTRYSAQGVLEFSTSNPALAISFAELIPNSTSVALFLG